MADPHLIPAAALFPLAALGLAFLVLIPAASLLSRWVLDRLPDDPLGRASSWRFLLLVAPVLAPLAWLASAALHEAEPGRVLAACADPGVCFDALLITLVVLVGLLGVATLELWRQPAAATPDARARARAELSAITGRTAALADVRGRVRAVSSPTGHVFLTRGLFFRRIEVDHSALHRLCADEIVAGLLHEREHLRAFDPFRGLVLRVCEVLNPARTLLRPHATAWRLARELDCDHGAVAAGADALALASALVIAARPRIATATACCALGGRGGPAALHWISLRVQLLCDYAQHGVTARARSLALVVGAVLLVALIAAPHADGPLGLSGLHVAVEAIAHSLP